MDPVTALAVGSMAASAAGAGISAYGQYKSGQASANMYQYQAGVAQINKQIADQNAEWETQAGEVRAQESGMKTAAQIATTKAIQGASGLDVNSGSNADVRASELEIGQYDEAVIRANAAHRAYGYTVKGIGEEATATMDTMAGSNAKTAGDISAIGSLVSGAGNVASKWLTYKSNFGPTPKASSTTYDPDSDY